ncbi:uncharacterized protein [Lolium perenne]|uniref:uncharacterized protein n=1 Tax=Lolium perenne TaxID=4522 RepID=UPI0021F5BE5F|nr:uncharacterized protein LOC127347433 [Lolium perenne]
MATAKRAKAKAARAKAAEAAKAAMASAYEAEWSARTEAARAAKVAKAKAEEADEAAKIATAKAQEAEEAAEIAKAMAEEAAKVKGAKDEMRRRLKEEETECEAEWFAPRFRRHWNPLYANRGVRTFLQTTSIPAMRYTHPASDDSPKAMEGLQIVSVKIASIKDPLHWPLQVYGVVAARDVLDHKRNIIFHRSRKNCQTITPEEPYLALTGPSRAIAVTVDPSYVEISLKVKGATKAEDKDLSELAMMYRAGCVLSGIYPSRLSTLELKFGHIARSVEATVSIKLKAGSWPSSFRGVFSAAIGTRDDLKVELLDSGDDGLPSDADGVIKLSRRVVSAGLGMPLKISIVASPIHQDQVVECREATFKPERASISLSELGVSFCSMEVSVAWSCFRYE